MVGVRGKKRLFVVCITSCAGMSMVLLLISLTNEHWLHTTERFDWVNNSLFSSINDTFVYRVTHFGLWRVCTFYVDTNDLPKTLPECTNTQFKETTSKAQNEEFEDGTLMNGIMQSSKRTAIFPIVSIILEVTAVFLCLIGYCCGRRRYLIFITGCIFVTSGMSLLAASVLFMGAVTGIANHQPQVPKDEVAIFRYNYAASFFMLNMAFCLDELSGVLSVYLFIIRHKEAVKRRHARLRAHKSKTTRMHQYVRRHSRLLSASSGCGETSRRSSNLVPEAETLPHQPEVRRDVSHMTMSTIVESNSQTHEAALPLVSNGLTAIDNSLTNGLPDYNSVISNTLIAPPQQFQSADIAELSVCKEDNSSTHNHLFNCKTTSV